MSARIRETFQAILVFGILFLGVFSPTAFSLPREKKEPAPAKTVQPVVEHTRFTPVAVDDDQLRQSGFLRNSTGNYRYLGPTRLETSTSPYVDVRIGIPETPGGATTICAGRWP